MLNPSCVRVLMSIKLQHLNHLTKPGKVTKIKKLPVKGITAEEVLALWQEGRLYLEETKTIGEGNIEDAYKREILDYVSSISCFATEIWKKNIDTLWQEIVEDARLKDCLVMKKGSSAGHMNRYTITNIVCRMQNRDVYRSDIPLLTLHLKLEGTKRKNKYYLSSGNYCLNKTAKTALNSLLLRV